MQLAGSRVLRVAVGAVVVGIVPLGAAGPAGAGEDSGTASVSFHLNGSPLTCGVSGSSASTFQDENDTAVIDASVVATVGPGCREALYGVTLFIRYETSPGSGTFATSRVDGATAQEDPGHAATGVQTRLEVPGPLGSITVQHGAAYVCDENPRTTTCSASVVTNPK